MAWGAPPARGDLTVELDGSRPTGIQVVSVLLIVNLALSVGVTVLSLTHIDELLRVTLAHRHLDGVPTPAFRRDLRMALYSRAVANAVVAVVYAYLIRGLRSGRRRAWRRAARLTTVGALGVAYLLTQPYPTAFKVEQVVQVGVLAAAAAVLFTPAMRAHFRKPAPVPARRYAPDPTVAASAWAPPDR